MSRGLSSPQLAAAAGRHRIVFPMIEALFDSGALRLTLAPWDLIVGADTYTHTQLVSVQPLGESAANAEGLEFTLSGINDSALLTIASLENVRGRTLRLLKAYVDADTNLVIGAPIVYWLGRMRSMPVTESNSEFTIALSVEHYDLALTRPAPRRLNSSDQKRDFPADLGCDMASQMSERKITWPSKEALRK